MSKLRPSEDELFADALELPVAERARFLDEHCSSDAPLREQVESLLQASAGAEGFLETSPIPLAASLFSAILLKTAEAPDGKIGPYLLRERLGEGGCGVVYLAEQERPIRRSVAIKVIKQGMDTKAVIARFEAERQALAMMEHPHIARIFEAGVTPMGRPFFAMELVRGLRVTDYCHQAKLTVTERIELFLLICRAVQHAHQKGIIHRDLKPSNILITLDDGKAVPKLIDFGIAKAIQGRLTELTLQTSVDQFIGTPAYMSPEQLGLGGRDVDTRSDLYSLGVVLYELLTGATPFGCAGNNNVTIDELRRRIREDDPLRPSSALSRVDLSLYYPLAPAKKLIKQLRGDLDWIVLRCLEKDPNLRFQSVHELSHDLGQFLASEPLPNRPSGAWQSFGKFVRRHQTAVVISTAMLAVLVAATSVSTREALRARRAEKLAESAGATAQKETAANKAVLDFLRNDLLSLASPERQSDRNLKLRTLVDHAAQKLDEGRFRNQPKVETEIRQTLAGIYSSLGLPVQARHQWEQILSATQAQLGPEDPTILGSLRGVVQSYRKERKFIQAEELALKILPLHEKVYGPEHEDTLKLANDLASAYWAQGKADQAQKLLLHTIDAQKRTLGAEHLATLNSIYTLTNVYDLQGRNEEKETLLRQLCEIGLRTRGPEDSFTLNSMHNLAFLYLKLDRLAEAEPLLTKIYQSYERKWGPEFGPAILAKSHLAFLFLYEAKLNESEKYFIELIETARQSIGPDHEYTVDGIRGLAAVYRYKGELDKAEKLAVDAKDAKTRAYGPTNPLLSWDMVELADIREAQGRLTEAKAFCSAALEQGKSIWSPTNRYRLAVIESLARISSKEQKFAEAEKLLRECLALRIEANKEHYSTYATRSLLGEVLLKMNRLDEARPLIEESDAKLNQLVDSIPPLLRTVLKESNERLSELHRLTGD